MLEDGTSAFFPLSFHPGLLKHQEQKIVRCAILNILNAIELDILYGWVVGYVNSVSIKLLEKFICCI